MFQLSILCRIMYICIYVYVYQLRIVCRNICSMQEHIYIYSMQEHVYVSTCICLNWAFYAGTCIHIFYAGTCICFNWAFYAGTCIYVYMYMYICTCIYVHINIHICRKEPYIDWIWMLGWLIHKGAICTRIAPLWTSTSNGTAWLLIWRSQVKRQKACGRHKYLN